MLFITNRALNEGPTPYIADTTPPQLDLPRQVSFNINNNQAQPSVFFCDRQEQGDYTEIGSQLFLQRLRDANVNQILIYIHGYSSLPEGKNARDQGIFDTTAALQQLCDRHQPNEVLVVPLIWPCDNDFGLVKDYYDDQIAADDSATAFMRMLEKFLDWRTENSSIQDPCLKRINILAHSMGNRVLRGALKNAVYYFQTAGLPLLFRNIFMVAADVVNETLEPGQNGEIIPTTARNVVVYYSADDLALRASKVANARDTSRRLGHTGPESLNNVSRNVYALDCADFNNEYDPPIGHTYFLFDQNGEPGLLFEHIWQCILTGRVKMEASNLRRQILNYKFW